MNNGPPDSSRNSEEQKNSRPFAARNRSSFKGKPLTRSHAMRESTSPPQTPSLPENFNQQTTKSYESFNSILVGAIETTKCISLDPSNLDPAAPRITLPQESTISTTARDGVRKKHHRQSPGNIQVQSNSSAPDVIKSNQIESVNNHETDSFSVGNSNFKTSNKFINNYKNTSDNQSDNNKNTSPHIPRRSDSVAKNINENNNSASQTKLKENVSSCVCENKYVRNQSDYLMEQLVPKIDSIKNSDISSEIPDYAINNGCGQKSCNLQSSTVDPQSSKQETDSQATEASGTDLVAFISSTLNKNAKDRLTMMRIEKELISLAKNKQQSHHKFPPMSSYNRMLVHRCAAFFGMEHNIDVSQQCVIVSTNKGSRLPDVRFREFVKDNLSFEEPKKSILKRDTHSFDDARTHLCCPDRHLGMDNRRSKSFEEREEAYEKARQRIFRENETDSLDDLPYLWSSTESPDSGSNLVNDSQTPFKLLKVQSLESRSSLGRPAVSKSFSFGGYGGPPNTALLRGDSLNSTKSAGPRLLTKQDSVGSSSTPWRLSPSSSGYKTQSIRSESITPSPTGINCRTPDPEMSSSPASVVWAVTDMASVPKGSVLIDPATGQPIINGDGTLYHYDPNNLPSTTSKLSDKPQMVLKRNNLDKSKPFKKPENENLIKSLVNGITRFNGPLHSEIESIPKQEPVFSTDQTIYMNHNVNDKNTLPRKKEHQSVESDNSESKNTDEEQTLPSKSSNECVKLSADIKTNIDQISEVEHKFKCITVEDESQINKSEVKTYPEEVTPSTEQSANQANEVRVASSSGSDGQLTQYSRFTHSNVSHFPIQEIELRTNTSPAVYNNLYETHSHIPAINQIMDPSVPMASAILPYVTPAPHQQVNQGRPLQYTNPPLTYTYYTPPVNYQHHHMPFNSNIYTDPMYQAPPAPSNLVYTGQNIPQLIYQQMPSIPVVYQHPNYMVGTNNANHSYVPPTTYQQPPIWTPSQPSPPPHYWTPPRTYGYYLSNAMQLPPNAAACPCPAEPPKPNSGSAPRSSYGHINARTRSGSIGSNVSRSTNMFNSPRQSISRSSRDNQSPVSTQGFPGSRSTESSRIIYYNADYSPAGIRPQPPIADYNAHVQIVTMTASSIVPTSTIMTPPPVSERSEGYRPVYYPTYQGFVPSNANQCNSSTACITASSSHPAPLTNSRVRTLRKHPPPRYNNNRLHKKD